MPPNLAKPILGSAFGEKKKRKKERGEEKEGRKEMGGGVSEIYGSNSLYTQKKKGRRKPEPVSVYE